MPKILSLKELLQNYIDYQKEIIIRRTKYDLKKAESRAHILEGYKIALANIDEIIKLIKEASDVNTAREGLMTNYQLSEKQADAILKMRLQNLTGLERDKIEKEYQELQEKIAYYRSILADDNKIFNIIKEELMELKDKFNDNRRTDILNREISLDIEDLIDEERIVVTRTHHGYIKRTSLDIYRNQRRGGKGIIGINTKEEDFVEDVFTTSTHHYFLFFTNKGKLYKLKGYQIPESGRQARGTAIVNLLQLEKDERITKVIPIKEFDADKYLVMLTKNGLIKKTSLIEYESNYTGLIALTLKENDELIDVKYTDGEENIIIATRQGMAIHFNEKDVRETGRTAQGVKAINLNREDIVIGMGVDSEGEDLLIITDNGYGKRTSLQDYRLQNRGGKGLITARITEKNGLLAGIKVVDNEHDLIIITGEGMIIRTSVREISSISRNTLGVKIINIKEGDKVVSLARISPEEEEDEKKEEIKE